MKEATIIGAGLVGSLWALFLARAGYSVKVFERRPDIRKGKLSQGKSINLAVSYRGWKALDEIGASEEIKKVAIPMYGRTIHDEKGETQLQPYGINNQAIYSVSRGEINRILLEKATATGKVEMFFDEEYISVESGRESCWFRNTTTGDIHKHNAEVIFATDGAFSSVRYNSFLKTDGFNYSQQYIKDGYKEILLPADKNGGFKLEKNSLHIWPRKNFMLIALPNFDGSFTCTLFMPLNGDEQCFSKLKSKSEVDEFFKTRFSDFYEIFPDVADKWDDHPTSSLAIIRCYPWFSKNTVLMGDAAHATVPFYGQGMNCGFEDCSVMWDLMKEHGNDWNKIFNLYQDKRKPNGDAVQDLSLQNYIVMRDKVADPDFLLQQKIERRVHELFPSSYFPLYSMVTFTDIEYAAALKNGAVQDAVIKEFIRSNNISNRIPQAALDELIRQKFSNN